MPLSTREYLVKHKYVGAGKVAINGASNGGQSPMHFLLIFESWSALRVGLLVGACVNRAPQGTFGAAVAEVGVMDLLKVCIDLTVTQW